MKYLISITLILVATLAFNPTLGASENHYWIPEDCFPEQGCYDLSNDWILEEDIDLPNDIDWEAIHEENNIDSQLDPSTGAFDIPTTTSPSPEPEQVVQSPEPEPELQQVVTPRFTG